MLLTKHNISNQWSNNWFIIW